MAWVPNRLITMIANDLFFPPLSRRTNYSRKRGGSYYQYDHYREEIREDCQLRCVYCDIHENECGGTDSMHLDHFRPQVHFDNLVNDPNNLVWSCPGCNRLKSDHWPALGTTEAYLGNEGFIEPFLMMRLDFFVVNEGGELYPLKPPAKYQLELLQLNRQSRKQIRLLRTIRLKIIERLFANAEIIERRVRGEPGMTPEGKLELLTVTRRLRSDAEALLSMMFSV